MRSNEELEQRDWNIYYAVVAALAIIAIATALIATFSIPTDIMVWIK